jgi:putative flippase GtrA
VSLAQFGGFAGVGAVATALQYVVLVSLVTAGLSPVVGSSIGFCLSALVNYYLNHRFTFQSTALHRDAIPRFAAMAFAGLLLNAALMAVLTPWVHYLVAQVIATGTVLVFNFCVSRLWTFKAPPTY